MPVSLASSMIAHWPLLTGAEAPALDRLIAYLRASHPEIELDVHDGGQPHYPLLLAAE